jgi:hypothetical protein
LAATAAFKELISASKEDIFATREAMSLSKFACECTAGAAGAGAAGVLDFGDVLVLVVVVDFLTDIYFISLRLNLTNVFIINYAGQLLLT